MSIIDSILKFLGQKSVVMVDSGSNDNWNWTLWSDGTAELEINAKNKSVQYGPTTVFGGYLGMVSEPLPDTGCTLSEFNVTGELIPQNTRNIQSFSRIYENNLQICAYADSSKTVYSDYNAQIKCKWK